MRRLEDAEYRLAHLSSGEAHRVALQKASELTNRLDEEEKERVRLEKYIHGNMSDSRAREEELNATLAAEVARVTLKDAALKKLKGQFWLKRSTRSKKRPSIRSATG